MPCGLRHWDLRWSSLWGHETCEGCAKMGPRMPCGLRHWDLRWSSLWGHETCEGCAKMGPRMPCGLRYWDPRWSSLWGHETCEGCAKMGRRRHANCATGTLGGAPCGARGGFGWPLQAVRGAHATRCDAC